MNRVAKILVVEDTESWQEIFGELLSAQGYSVAAAKTFKEAKQLLEKQAFDAAVVDIRLSEVDATNKDGMKVLELIRETGDPTGIIIASGTATATLARDAIIKFRALDVIEKNLFEESEFLRSVDRGIQEAHAMGFGDKSLYDVLLREPGRTVQKASHLPGSRQDLENLLRNILSDLWPLSSTPRTIPRLSETYEGEPLVQIEGWSKGIGNAIVVRLGGRKVIKRESQNYNKYISGLVETAKSTIKRETVYQANLGGITYVLPEAKNGVFRDFYAFYATSSTFDTLEALRDLFWRICANLYLGAGIDRVKVDLSARYRSMIEQAVAYQEHQRNEEGHFLNQLEDDERQSYLEARERRNRRTVNPIDFVRDRRFIFDSPVGVVHGALHGGNVLIDSRAHVWLIGFYDTGTSDVLLEDADDSNSVSLRAFQAGKRNLLHDFASLEVSIRSMLTHLDAKVVREFDLALCAPTDFGELFYYNAPATLPQLDKASRTISRLRELAYEIVDFKGDMQLYYVELLFQFLNTYLRLPEQGAKERIWASATVLANRLDQWP